MPRAAADLQDASPRRSLPDHRYVAEECLNASCDLGVGVAITKISAHRLMHQNVARRRPDRQIGRQLEQVAEVAIPYNEPAFSVEYAEAFANIFQCPSQQLGFAASSLPKTNRD